MALHTFRIGDILKPDDELSLFIANVSMAFNDLIFTNVEMDRAEEPWKRFYFSRLAFAHLSEVMLYLESKRESDVVSQFMGERVPEKARGELAAAMARYDQSRGVLNRLRNETVFHYPKGSSERTIGKAIEAAQDDEGQADSEISTKVKDARMFFARTICWRVWCS